MARTGSYRLMAAVLVLEAGLYRTRSTSMGYQSCRYLGARHIQYQMLKNQQAIVLPRHSRHSLVESLPTADRVVAKQVYELTVKARNAFAHGAVPRLNGDTVDCVGHLLVKSVQALVGAGIHGMTKEQRTTGGRTSGTAIMASPLRIGWQVKTRYSTPSNGSQTCRIQRLPGASPTQQRQSGADPLDLHFRAQSSAKTWEAVLSEVGGAGAPASLRRSKAQRRASAPAWGGS